MTVNTFGAVRTMPQAIGLLQIQSQRSRHLDSEFLGERREIFPSGRLDVDACLLILRFPPSPRFPWQEDFAETGRALGRLYERDELVDFVVERL